MSGTRGVSAAEAGQGGGKGADGLCLVRFCVLAQAEVERKVTIKGMGCQRLLHAESPL